MTTPKDTERFVRALSQRVVRIFYGTPESIVVDQLIKKAPAVKDEELAGRLGVSTRELARTIQPLLEAGVVLSWVRNELREGAARVTPRVWYYQDLRHFRDSLKWRMHVLHEQFEAENKDEIAALGMVCPRCKKEYSLLDVGPCANGQGGFDCEVCGAELVENNAAAELADSRDQVKRFLEQCKTINEALKTAADMQLSSFEIDRWLRINHPIDTTGASVISGSTTPVAGGSGGTNPSAVQVKLETEAEVEARKRKEEEEEIAKRAANAQPTWFVKSTVEAERQGTPDPLADRKPETIKLEGEDDDEDEYETLFGSRSAASTPATSLEHSGIFSSDLLQPGGKRPRAEDSDSESAGSNSKKPKIQPPSSPVIVEEVASPARSDDEEEEDFAFEAVEDDLDVGEPGERLFSCGGEMLSYDVLASNLNVYQPKMTPEEWQTFLSA